MGRVNSLLALCVLLGGALPALGVFAASPVPSPGAPCLLNCPPSPSPAPSPSPSPGPSPAPTPRAAPSPTSSGGDSGAASPKPGVPAAPGGGSGASRSSANVTGLTIEVPDVMPAAGEPVRVTAVANSQTGSDTVGVGGVSIHFDLRSAPGPGAAFSQSDAVTDANGFASVLLKTSDIPGDTAITASSGTLSAGYDLRTYAPGSSAGPVTQPPPAPSAPSGSGLTTGPLTSVVGALLGLLLPLMAVASALGQQLRPGRNRLASAFDRQWSDLQRLMAR